MAALDRLILRIIFYRHNQEKAEVGKFLDVLIKGDLTSVPVKWPKPTTLRWLQGRFKSIIL